jgi:hypothetical protein
VNAENEMVVYRFLHYRGIKLHKAMIEKQKKMLKNRAIKNNCGDFFVKILGFAWLQKFRSTNEDE